MDISNDNTDHEAAVIDLSFCWNKKVGRNAIDLLRYMATHGFRGAQLR